MNGTVVGYFDPSQKTSNDAFCWRQTDRHTTPLVALDSDQAPAAAQADFMAGLTPLSDAMRAVIAERHRQVEMEGWTYEHDDQHAQGEMAQAAACYALGAMFVSGADTFIWPWDLEWWKPRDRRQNLVRAGALLVAEIERLDRNGRRRPRDDEACDAEDQDAP